MRDGDGDGWVWWLVILGTGSLSGLFLSVIMGCVLFGIEWLCV